MITYKEADTTLNYVPETGNFTWKRDIGTHKAGSPAGFRRQNGRQYVQISGKEYPLAKIAWLLMRQEWPLRIYVHNGIKSDIHFANLTPKKSSKKVKIELKKEVKKVKKLLKKLLERITKNLRKNKPKPLVNPKPIVVMETKPRINGKARLSQFDDLPELIFCICPNCCGQFYLLKINYTKHIPSLEYVCKKCRKKRTKYTFAKTKKDIKS